MKIFKNKVVRRVGRFGLSIISTAFIMGSMGSAGIAADSPDAVSNMVKSESGKEALNTALKVCKGKPALSIAAGITCLACMPATGPASPAMCVACGILITKVIG